MGAALAPRVLRIAERQGCSSILDYGAGRSSFTVRARELGSSVSISEYEPGRAELAVCPPACDMTICLDVLEHVETDHVVAVLDHLRELHRQVSVFNIATAPAGLILPDGRNAHLTVWSHKRWHKLIANRWQIRNWEVREKNVWCELY